MKKKHIHIKRGTEKERMTDGKRRKEPQRKIEGQRTRE